VNAILPIFGWRETMLAWAEGEGHLTAGCVDARTVGPGRRLDDDGRNYENAIKVALDLGRIPEPDRGAHNGLTHDHFDCPVLA
jgi:hypothetical protein